MSAYQIMVTAALLVTLLPLVAIIVWFEVDQIRHPERWPA